jgi:hypothetical protein
MTTARTVSRDPGFGVDGVIAAPFRTRRLRPTAGMVRGTVCS